MASLAHTTSHALARSAPASLLQTTRWLHRCSRPSSSMISSSSAIVPSANPFRLSQRGMQTQLERPTSSYFISTSSTRQSATPSVKDDFASIFPTSLSSSSVTPTPSVKGKERAIDSLSEHNPSSQVKSQPERTAAVEQTPESSTSKPTTSATPVRRKLIPRAKKAAITLTPSAVTHLRALVDDSSNPQLIRISVKNRGCAGMAYHLEYVTPPGEKFDEVVEQDGVKVLIDSKALFSIIGSKMDWQEDRLSAKFVFQNPNIKDSCGCGDSFNV